jgi:transcriptional regulator with XRE-family HTH domain
MEDIIQYNRIKSILALKGRTSTDLAKHLDKSIYTISKWSTNKGQPTIPDLYNVAEFLGVPVYDLLEPKPVSGNTP